MGHYLRGLLNIWRIMYVDLILDTLFGKVAVLFYFGVLLHAAVGALGLIKPLMYASPHFMQVIAYWLAHSALWFFVITGSIAAFVYTALYVLRILFPDEFRRITGF